MMKSIPIILFLFSLVSCSYRSEQKATEACDAWRIKQDQVTITSFRDEQPLKPVDREKELKLVLLEIEKEDLNYHRDPKRFRAETRAFQINFYSELAQEDLISSEMINHQVTARWCRQDIGTNQILGYENNLVVNKNWQNKQGMKGEGLVVKRFRY